MGKGNAMSLDAFKELVSSNGDVRDGIIGRTDLIDLDNGVMRIYSEHLGKYLEKYCCKDADDLMDTLWYGYGVYCQVIY